MDKSKNSTKKVTAIKLDRPDDWDSDVEGLDTFFPNDGYDYEQHLADIDEKTMMRAVGDVENDFSAIYGKDPKLWTAEEREMFLALGSDNEDDLIEADDEDFQPLQFAAMQQVDSYELRWGKYTQEERYGNIDWGHGGVGEFDAGDFDPENFRPGGGHSDNSGSGAGSGAPKKKSKAGSHMTASQMARSATGSKYQRTFIGSKAATRVGRDFDKFTAITSKTVNELKDEDREVLERKFEDIRKDYVDDEVGELSSERAKGHMPLEAMRSIFDAAFEEMVLGSLHSKRRNKKFDTTVNRMVKQSEDMEDEEDEINWGKHKWQNGTDGVIPEGNEDGDEDEEDYEDVDEDEEDYEDIDEDEEDYEDIDEEEEEVVEVKVAPKKKIAQPKRVEKSNLKIFTEKNDDDFNWGDDEVLDENNLLTAEELYGQEDPELDALARQFEYDAAEEYWDGDIEGDEDTFSDLTDEEDLTEEERMEKRTRERVWMEQQLKIYQKRVTLDPLEDMPEELELAIEKQRRREEYNAMLRERAGLEDDVHFRRERQAIRDKISATMAATVVPEEVREQIIRFAREQAEQWANRTEEDEEALLPEYLKDEEEPEHDVETIVSTLSSVYNRPTRIGLPRGPKPQRMQLVGSAQMPTGVLPANLAKSVGMGSHLAAPDSKKKGGLSKLAAILEGDSDEEEEEDEEAREDVNSEEEGEDVTPQRVTAADIGERSKKETAEEKKARKEAAKQLKAQARDNKREKKEQKKEAEKKEKGRKNNPYDLASGMRAFKL